MFSNRIGNHIVDYSLDSGSPYNAKSPQGCCLCVVRMLFRYVPYGEAFESVLALAPAVCELFVVVAHALDYEVHSDFPH